MHLCRETNPIGSQEALTHSPGLVSGIGGMGGAFFSPLTDLNSVEGIMVAAPDEVHVDPQNNSNVVSLKPTQGGLDVDKNSKAAVSTGSGSLRT